MPVGFPNTGTLGVGNNGKLSLKNSRFPPILSNTARQLMASPPTVTWTTSASAGTAPGGATTASITTTVLTVTGTPAFLVLPGMKVAGGGATANTIIVNQLTGTTGGNGTYTVNKSQTVGSASLTFSSLLVQMTDEGAGSSIGRPNVGGPFSFYRGGNVVVKANTFPDYTYAGTSNVNLATVASPVFDNVGMAVGFIHTGRFICFYLGGYGANVQVKINDQYLTFTHKVLANDGSLNYGLLDFGSSGRRRVELLIDGGKCFGGVYTGFNDVIQRAPVRGPRVMVVGDSYVGGSAGSCAIECWPPLMAEFMGWDDIWSSGVGGTGFLAVGGKATYRQRFATDVIPYKPDMIILQASVNDGSQTSAALVAEVTTCIQVLQAALPNTVLAVSSPGLEFGPAYGPYSGTTGVIQQRTALQALCAQLNIIFLDVQQYPLPSGYTPDTTTLSANISANATSCTTAKALKAGAAYQWPDGTISNCTAASGGGAPFTNTLDNSINAQTLGAVLVEVGSSPYSGNGKVGSPTGVGTCDNLVYSDGVHPTSVSTAAFGDGGSGVIAEQLTTQLLNILYSN